MDKAQIIQSIFAALNVSVLCISVYFLWSQIKKGHMWNRAEASQKVLIETVCNDIFNVRKKLELEFGMILGGTQTYDDIAKSITDQDKLLEFEFCAKHLFNYFEMLFVGIKNNVYEEDICYDFIRIFALNYFSWGRSFFEKNNNGGKMAWREFQHYVDIWENKMEQSFRVQPQPRT